MTDFSFSLLSLKKESEAYENTMLSVSVSTTNNANLHEINQMGHAIEGDLYAIFYNPIASTILKCQMFRRLEVNAKLDQVTMGPFSFCADRSFRDEQLLLRPFL
jgi:hypothetical protein